MESRVTIRPFMLGDYDAAITLWQSVDGVEICEGDSREEIAIYVERNAGLSCVAEVDGTIAGAALCGHDGRRGYIYHLAVAKAFRDRSIGKLLAQECLAGLRRAGIRRAIILVASDNPLGREFWIRNGWEDIESALAMARDV